MKYQVTLRPGDYVSTKGLTEDDYHAVARAFMAAGAESGEYPSEPERMARPYFGFGERGMMKGNLCHAYLLNGRHLTPQQVIGATNAGTTTPDPLTTILEQAAEHDATAKHHAAMHDRLMQQAREMLPDGWRLVHDTEPGTDMTDPANWREGDVLVCISTKNDYGQSFEYGHAYAMAKSIGCDEDRWIDCVIGKGKTNNLPADHFTFHHRP